MSEQFTNPDDESIRALLAAARTIAVVGLSANPARPSHGVARALQRHGFRIVPVNPNVGEVLGETAYAALDDIPFTVDIVDVFRSPQHVPALVDTCLRLGLSALWLQDGVVHAEAALRARQAGMTVVMNRCIARDGLALLRPRRG